MCEILTVLEPLMALHGYLPGLRQPALLATLSLATDAVLVALPERLDAAMLTLLPDAAAPPVHAGPMAGSPALSAILRILHWIQELQREAGLPVFEAARIHSVHRSQPLLCRVAIPVDGQGHGAARLALTWVCRMVSALGAGRSVEPVAGDLSAVLKSMKAYASSAINTIRFLQAAYALDIPFQRVAGPVFQFGQGAHGRWLDSSFTDATPAISALLARNKHFAATVLRRAGLPVPPHILVADGAAAVAAAERLGYPVVVKPADLDGGIGVTAGLRTAHAVMKAFAIARQRSSTILVEKHVDGRDYRLVVFGGALVWAIERIPGGVTGDGRWSVRELLDHLNRDPRRGTGPSLPLRRVDLDEEAVELLIEAGLSPESIPAAGQFVRLRGAANIASGGTPVAVFDQVHPDNRRLAERAAALLRLDLAGVDLLIPDIARSWHDTGASICEINGQPSLGPITAAHLFGQIMQRLVSGNGRIPIAVVVGDTPDGSVAENIGRALIAAGRSPGWTTADGVWIKGERVPFSGSVLAAGQLLTADPTVDSAVLSIPHKSALKAGLPVDRCDVLVVAGGGSAPTHAETRPAIVDDLLRILLPACDGPVLHDSPTLPLPAVPPGRLRLAEALPETACAVLLAADAAHRAAREGGIGQYNGGGGP